MKRNTFCFLSGLFLLVMGSTGQAQDLVVNAFIPPGSLIAKEQLWNVIISNPTTTARSCQLSLTIVNKANGTKMMTALSNTVLVPGGARQLQVADMMPVMYNALHENVNLGGQGLLPVGTYQVCYDLVGQKGASYGSSCVDVQVEALAPPQLIFPENKSELKERQPAFSWIPPAPITLLRHCTYAYRIVQVNINQTPADAIRDNVPVYRATRLLNTTLTYPASAPALEKEQLYAWQISAQTATADINSDVWSFTIRDKELPKAGSGDGTAYTKLAKRGEQTGYSVVGQTLRFAWQNESIDTLFQMRILDVTGGNHLPVSIRERSIPVFAPGMNLIDLDLQQTGRFLQDHMYELCLIDKQGEEWKLLFEYKGKRK